MLAVTVLDNGGVVPTPWEVVRALWDDHRLMWTSAKSTVQIAAKGWLIGNGLAIGLAVVFFGVPVVERVLLQIGVASYCLPIIAIGPILTTVFDGSTPQIALAGISVFFTTMVGTLLGLRAADPASLDVVRASGGGAWKQMRYIRLRAALPSTFAGLQIAAPAAVLGAIIGEFLGADRGARRGHGPLPAGPGGPADVGAGRGRLRGRRTGLRADRVRGPAAHPMGAAR
nr:ABC transporter permease subunit [Frankia sp. ArI3]